ncbi:unnamed protein product [Ilex paraguariensis]|uniref:Uncharacterized protein n=1 Tax=Ilex paraguariensis TaxID=185542 RepID=A0ABC8R3R5_9AQUA
MAVLAPQLVGWLCNIRVLVFTQKVLLVWRCLRYSNVIGASTYDGVVGIISCLSCGTGNPLLIMHAAVLLRHPHLQPYVLKVHLKLNSPRRNSLPTHWQYPEEEDVPVSTIREKRLSFGNDRTLNPSISGAEQDSSVNTQRNPCTPSFLNRKMAELSVGSTHEVTTISKRVVSKTSNVAKNQRLTPTKTSDTTKRQTELFKNRELVRPNCLHFISILQWL